MPLIVVAHFGADEMYAVSHVGQLVTAQMSKKGNRGLQNVIASCSEKTQATHILWRTCFVRGWRSRAGEHRAVLYTFKSVHWFSVAAVS